MTTRWAGLLPLLLAGVALAETKVDRVPATQAAGQVYSLDLHDLSITDCIAQFKDKTHINFIYENPYGNRQQGGPEVLYDVSFKDLSEPEAIKALAKALQLGINWNSDAVRLSPNSSGGDMQVRDKPTVEVSSVSRTRTIPPTPEQPSQISLQLRVFGGRSPIAGPVRLENVQAVDEAGRTLEWQDRNNTFGGNDGQGSVFAQAGLKPADTPSKAIQSFKGQAVLPRAKTLLRIKTDELGDKPVRAELGSVTMVIGPVKPAGPNASLPIAFERTGANDAEWRRVYNQVNQLRKSVIRGPGGETLTLNPHGWSSDNKKITVEASLDGPAVQPKTFEWETVGETEDQSVAFEVGPIDLP